MTPTNHTKQLLVGTRYSSYATTDSSSKKKERKNGNKSLKGPKKGQRQKDEPAKDSEAQKDFECWNCGEHGHIAKKCPKEKKSFHVKCLISSDQDPKPIIAEHEAILDFASEVSLLHPSLVSDITPLESSVFVGGIAKDADVEIRHQGKMKWFGTVLTSEDVGVNIICGADVDDQWGVEHIQGKGFKVKLPNCTLFFEKRGKLYIGDMSAWLKKDYKSFVTTTADIEATLPIRKRNSS